MPVQQMPDVTTEESSTAIIFMAPAEFLLDLPDDGHQFPDGRRTRSGVVLVQGLKLLLDAGPFLFLFAPDQVADNVARGVKAAFHSARLQPSQLAGAERDI